MGLRFKANLADFFSQADFMPHGHCYLWNPWLVGTHLASDAIIAASYFAIAVMLYVFIVRRHKARLSAIVFAFGAFIAACGATHVMEIWTLWRPDYWASGAMKAATAGASALTAIFLFNMRSSISDVLSSAKLSEARRKELETLNRDLEARVLDRTERLENALLEQSTLLESALGGFIGVDRDWTVTIVNSELAIGAGLAKEQIIGRNFWEVFPHAGGPSSTYRFQFHRAMDERVSVEFESPDSPLGAWTEYRVSPRSGGGIAIFLHDIEDRHQAQEELARTTAILKTIADASSDIIFAKDLESRVLFGNPALFELVGQPPLWTLGRSDLEFYGEDGGGAAIVANDRMVIQSGVAQTFEETVGPRPKDQAGGQILGAPRERKLFLSSKAPIFDDSGRVAGLVGISKDITARKKAEEELQKAKKAAEEANQIKSVFVANMSHEIRTPLSAILGFTELLRDPDISEEERVEFVETIARNGLGLRQLVDDILDLSKVEAGKLDVATSILNPAELVGETVALFNVLARERGLRLNYSAAENLPDYVSSDPVRLKQILSNLIGNAVKFTERGEIDVHVSGDESSFAVEIRDTGIGISQTQAELLFEPFKQADGSISRRYGGTGLGLMLSRQLARLLGGEVNLIKSEMGKGSVFEARFKNFAAQTSTRASSQIPLKAPGHELDLGGMHILVVDDSPDNQNLISRVLKKHGARVEIAANGALGVLAAQSADPDVILMDISMPVMDGFEATTLLRSRGFEKPIIALTAHAIKEIRDQYITAGYTDYMVKPIDFRKLISAVKRYNV